MLYYTFLLIYLTIFFYTQLYNTGSLIVRFPVPTYICRTNILGFYLSRFI